MTVENHVSLGTNDSTHTIFGDVNDPTDGWIVESATPTTTTTTVTNNNNNNNNCDDETVDTLLPGSMPTTISW